jgi:hypothetical protein
VSFSPRPGSDVSVYASIVGSWLSLAGYSETNAGSPFPATIAPVSAASTVARLGAAWTTAVTPVLDMTLSAEMGHVFGSVQVEGSVAGRTFAGSDNGFSFADVEATASWRASDALRIDATAGATLAEHAGAALRAGSTLRLAF